MDILDQLTAWGREEASIRAMLLLGSRAAGIAGDAFSDYDIFLLVDRPNELLRREADWIPRFGKVLVGIPERGSLAATTYPNRLLLYRSGLKVDFNLCPTALMEQALNQHDAPEWMRMPYRVLLDKDDWQRKMLHFRPARAAPQRPTEAAFTAVVEEFFWEVTYIAKQLYRGELWPAQYSQWVARERALLPMLKWYEQARHDWKYDSGYQVRRIPQWLSAECYRQLLATFAGPEPEANWRALSALILLFRETAQAVATKLAYVYPVEVELGVLAYQQDRVGASLLPDA